MKSFDCGTLNPNQPLTPLESEASETKLYVAVSSIPLFQLKNYPFLLWLIV